MPRFSSSAINAANVCSKCSAEMSVVNIARDNGYYRLSACSPCGDRFWTRDGQRVDPEDAIAGLGQSV